ncbi:ClpV1 family T6SS ATPase [Parazoarcus communis]|uniref:ClpV1 family T6SS ATPase n=1 Tax=Parazoarcus communis TaxID=41977 RepID=A0A2U8H771_9RHOO|nr:type VI secretion system ATPase TssH [Parazoarcus communis]AWI81026.1 ClpV1 family T6SS ATPase [Parazoarcus communis]
MHISLKALIAKLNPDCRVALERAASLCVARTHHVIEPEHVLLALCEQETTDFVLVCRSFGVSAGALADDLERTLSGNQTGNAQTPVFSARLVRLLERAWLHASLESQSPFVRSAHVLFGLAGDPELSQLAQRFPATLGRVRIDALRAEFDSLTSGSSEGRVPPCSAADAEGSNGFARSGADPASRRTPALDRFTVSLTRLARAGKLDPVIGRDAEIRRMIDILMRRRQNNPMLAGEAGVGKTAVVEGLALRLASGDVPPALRDVELLALDIGLLQAGASVKGEFEQRLKGVIDEVRASVRPVILFIDEAHGLIGAGGPVGQGDAANLLKPALARGELRTVGATTWAEYKKYIDKDAALSRRFQVVRVDEPDETLACAMLRATVPALEAHFGIRVLEEAVIEAVRLSSRYIGARQLPDKAVSVLDTACARVALGQCATPAELEDARQGLARLREEQSALKRESLSSAEHHDRLAELDTAIARQSKVLETLHKRFEREQALVRKIRQAQTALEALPATGASARGSGRRRGGTLDRLLKTLASVQQNASMVPLQVDRQLVADVVSGWTGIPLGRMLKDEIRTILGLKALMAERVRGQDHALEAVAQRVRTARANLEDPCKPKAVFLFVGPSGVGKTETALALADLLYGGERKLVTINMSEYQEAHSVAGLKGSPPGYVGYGEGGVLTEAVRRNPHCVLLLDEVEKAHPDVLELFFQVFDKGVLEDAEGREIDFRNTLIILTSNVGSAQIMASCLNVADEAMPTADELAARLAPVLHQRFKAAFLGRMKVVPFYPISDTVLAEIIELKLSRIRERVAANHKARFVHDDTLTEAVLARCTEVDSGARNVDHILNGSLLPEIAGEVLARMADGEAVREIRVSAGEQGQFRYSVA